MKAQVKKVPYLIHGPFSNEAEKLILSTLSKNENRPEPKHSKNLRKDLDEIESERNASMKLPYSFFERYFEWRFGYPHNSLKIAMEKALWYGKKKNILTIRLACS